MYQLKTKRKKILAILLVLMMAVQVFPLTVFADNGVSWIIPEENAVAGIEFDLLMDVAAVAEDGSELAVEVSGVSSTDEDYPWNGTDTTIMPEEAGEYEVTYRAVSAEEGTVVDIHNRTVIVEPAKEPDTDNSNDNEAVAEDESKETMDTMLSNTRLNGTSADITDNITFDNVALTVSGNELDPDDPDNVFPYSYGYKLVIDWSAAASDYYDAGDYFTFSVPDGFHSTLTYDIKDPDTGTVLGSLTFTKNDDGTTTGKITFNENIENMSNIKGTITLTASYLITEEGEEVYWEIKLGETVVEIFEGESEGFVNGNGYTTFPEGVYKNGYKTSASAGMGDNTYFWYAYLNTQLDNWNAKTTVTDTFKDGTYKLRPLGNRTVDEAEGYYGDPSWSGDNKAYLWIVSIDWKTMGQAYNDLIDAAYANGETTLDPNAEFGLSGHPLYQIEDSNGQLIKYTTGEKIPSLMLNVMRTQRYQAGDNIPADKSVGDYKYIDYFDPDNVNVTITDGGFTIEFDRDTINEYGIYIDYYTDITAVTPVSQLVNDLTVTFEDETDPTYVSSHTIDVTATATVEGEKIPGEIKLYKTNRNQSTVFSGVAFTLEDKNDPDKYLTASTGADGTLTFKLSEVMSAPYTGTYILTEDPGTTPAGYVCIEPIEIGLDADGKIISINGTAIADEYEGNVLDLVYVLKDHQTLAVYNYTSPTPETLNLTGEKTLAGKKLEDNMFSFVVTDDNNNNAIVATGTNDANGTITFSDITYTAAGSHSYTVKEVDDKAGGITYDMTGYTVTVDVIDDGDGTLTATVNYPESGLVFNNEYTTDSTTVTLEGTKNLAGKELEDDMFSFVVKDENNDIVSTGSNKAGGGITFSEISLSSAGTYSFTVSEVNGGAGEITYDETEYAITVDVEDNGDGTLSATVNYPESGLVFNNEYATGDPSAAFTGTKNLTGKELTDDMFSFVVKDKEGEIVSTGTNKADGTIAFSKIGFTDPGVYTFEVSEVKGNAEGITYDKTEYTAVVTVLDNGDGTLTAEVSYPDGKIKFNNSYSGGTETNKQNNKNPSASGTSKTGDESMPYRWFIVIFVSVSIIGILLWNKKRRPAKKI